MPLLTATQSKQLIKELISTALPSILYLRHGFSEQDFVDDRFRVGGSSKKSIKAKQLVPASPEAATFLAWMDDINTTIDLQYLQAVELVLLSGEQPQQESFLFSVDYTTSSESPTGATTGHGKSATLQNARTQALHLLKQLISNTQNQLPARASNISIRLLHTDLCPPDYHVANFYTLTKTIRLIQSPPAMGHVLTAFDTVSAIFSTTEDFNNQEPFQYVSTKRLRLDPDLFSTAIQLPKISAKPQNKCSPKFGVSQNLNEEIGLPNQGQNNMKPQPLEIQNLPGQVCIEKTDKNGPFNLCSSKNNLIVETTSEHTTLQRKSTNISSKNDDNLSSPSTRGQAYLNPTKSNLNSVETPQSSECSQFNNDNRATKSIEIIANNNNHNVTTSTFTENFARSPPLQCKNLNLDENSPDQPRDHVNIENTSTSDQTTMLFDKRCAKLTEFHLLPQGNVSTGITPDIIESTSKNINNLQNSDANSTLITQIPLNHGGRTPNILGITLVLQENTSREPDNLYFPKNQDHEGSTLNRSDIITRGDKILNNGAKYFVTSGDLLKQCERNQLGGATLIPTKNNPPSLEANHSPEIDTNNDRNRVNNESGKVSHICAAFSDEACSNYDYYDNGEQYGGMTSDSSKIQGCSGVEHHPEIVVLENHENTPNIRRNSTFKGGSIRFGELPYADGNILVTGDINSNGNQSTVPGRTSSYSEPLNVYGNSSRKFGKIAVQQIIDCNNDDGNNQSKYGMIYPSNERNSNYRTSNYTLVNNSSSSSTKSLDVSLIGRNSTVNTSLPNNILNIHDSEIDLPKSNKRLRQNLTVLPEFENGSGITIGCSRCHRAINPICYGNEPENFPESCICFRCLYPRGVHKDLVILITIRYLWHYLMTDDFPMFSKLYEILSLKKGKESDEIIRTVLNKLLKDNVLMVVNKPCYDVPTLKFMPGSGVFQPTFNGIINYQKNLELEIGTNYSILFVPKLRAQFPFLSYATEMKRVYFPNYKVVKSDLSRTVLKWYRKSLDSEPRPQHANIFGGCRDDKKN